MDEFNKLQNIKDKLDEVSYIEKDKEDFGFDSLALRYSKARLELAYEKVQRNGKLEHELECYERDFMAFIDVLERLTLNHSQSLKDYHKLRERIRRKNGAY